ncbi:MAG: hypothetical protein HZB39_01695 [Planctomycetes bacterium]|nr:hypothetical protein [Planctomycetota bacterium]
MATFALIPASLSAQQIVEQQRLERLRESYATVAANLLAPLDSESAKPEPKFDPAVFESRERWRAIVLETIESPDKRLDAIAREGAKLQQQVVKYLEESDDPSDVAEYLSSLGEAAAVEVKQRSSDPRQNWTSRVPNELALLIQRRRAVGMMLAMLAPDMGGSPAEAPPVEIDFDKRRFIPAVPDRLKLRNISGSTLKRCTIQVDVRGQEGNWVRNLHFLPAWADGEWRVATYATVSDGDPIAALGLSTKVVQAIIVSVWCDGLRSEGIAYQYEGASFEADMNEELARHMNVTVEFEKSPYSEPGPSLLITIHGVPSIPPSRVTLNCEDGGATAPFQFARDEWDEDSRYSYPTRGALRSCPKSVEVTIALDGMGVTWTKRVAVTERR